MTSGGFEFKGSEIEPLVNLGVFPKVVSVKSLTLSGEISETGSGVGNFSLGDFEDESGGGVVHEFDGKAGVGSSGENFVGSEVS